MADSAADLDDWEILLGAEAEEDHDSRPVAGEEASDSDGVAVKVDYFDLDSDARYPNRVASSGNLQPLVAPLPSAVVEDELTDLKLVNPGSDDCEFRLQIEKETTLGEIDCLQSDSQVLLSHELVDVENKELVGANLGDDDEIVEEVGKVDLNLVNPSQSEEDVNRPQVELGGFVVGDNFSGVAEEDKKEMDNCCEADSEESAKAASHSSDVWGVGDEGVSSKDISPVEKSTIVWWKLPLEFLKFCAFRMKPMWSISVVATLLGAFVLTKKLYRMKQNTRTIPLKISFDKKKASQFKIQAARLNETFSVVRHVPVIRASSLTNNGSSPWPLVGFQ